MTDPRQAAANACALTLNTNCRRLPFTTSPFQMAQQATDRYSHRVTLGPPLDPALVKALETAMPAAERLLALNRLLGALPQVRVEQTDDYKIMSRDEQLSKFATTYFPGLTQNANVVYGGDEGPGRYGRFCAAGTECGKTTYDRDTIVILEQAFREGADVVGTTLFHEELEMLMREGVITHDEVYDKLEALWKEWFNQPNE